MSAPAIDATAKAIERRQLRTIVDRGQEQSGGERHGIAGGRHHRRQPGREQRGKGDDRGAADDRCHDAAGDAGDDEQSGVQEVHRNSARLPRSRGHSLGAAIGT
jgi:hypothetical protein